MPESPRTQSSADKSRPLLRVTLALVGVASLGVAFGIAQERSGAGGSDFLRIDPDRTVIANAKGKEPCGECHTPAWEVWRETQHAKGYDELHRKESARDILSQMGLRVTKRQEAVCMRCHYTVGPDRKAVAGVSCESCHGPARDWIDIHNKVADATPAERERLVAQAREAGMLRPSSDLYAVTANCFECHTVPQEDLVNRGGHSTGSTSFDLVDRVDDIRHNFLHADGIGDPSNRPISPERKRLMFVIGKMLAYEYALRGLAQASAEGPYAGAMNRRVKAAHKELEDVARLITIPQVTEILQVGSDLRLVPGNRQQLEVGADRIRAAGQAFARGADGAVLAILDPAIAGERIASAAPASTPPSGAASATAPAAGRAAAAGGAAATAAPTPQLPGEVRKRPHWFGKPGPYRVVGAGECAGCHGTAEEWWFSDPHQTAGRRLFGEDPQARQIARLYGIGPAAMARADQICTSCHTTVDEAAGVIKEEGVSCESCHGAGSGFLDPHEDGGNPQKGMKALKQPEARAQTCARCHHVTDERLLAAGHPSGSDYDIVEANQRIEHWPGRRPERGRKSRGESYTSVAGGALRAAFQAAVSGRPIPRVAVVMPPPPAPRATGPRGSASGPSTSGAGPAASGRSAGGSAVPPRMPRTPPPSGPASVSLEAEPLPESTAEMTAEEVLLMVKRRLARIYAAVGRGN